MLNQGSYEVHSLLRCPPLVPHVHVTIWCWRLTKNVMPKSIGNPGPLFKTRRITHQLRRSYNHFVIHSQWGSHDLRRAKNGERSDPFLCMFREMLLRPCWTSLKTRISWTNIKGYLSFNQSHLFVHSTHDFSMSFLLHPSIHTSHIIHQLSKERLVPSSGIR